MDYAREEEVPSDDECAAKPMSGGPGLLPTNELTAAMANWRYMK